MPSVHKQRGRGPCPASARARVGAAMASCWHETKAWPALSTICIHTVDLTKLKYLAIIVMTAASTVLAKSVRFLEHVSPGCCAGIVSIKLCRYPGPRESVHTNPPIIIACTCHGQAHYGVLFLHQALSEILCMQ